MFKYSLIYIMTLIVEFLAFLGYRWMALEQGVLNYDPQIYFMLFNNLLVLVTLVAYMHIKYKGRMGIKFLSTGDIRNYQIETLGYEKEKSHSGEDFYGNKVSENGKNKNEYINIFAYISVLLTNLLGFIVYLVM